MIRGVLLNGLLALLVALGIEGYQLNNDYVLLTDYDQAAEFLVQRGFMWEEANWMIRLVHAECGVFDDPYLGWCAAGVLDSLFSVMAPTGILPCCSGQSMWIVLTHVGPEGYWNYPPWVTHGCVGLYDSRACLDGQNMDEAANAVTRYFLGLINDAPCRGYMYYHSMEGQPVDCWFNQGRFFMAFHTGWHGYSPNWPADGFDPLWNRTSHPVAPAPEIDKDLPVPY